jgi:hypothetical protein
VDPVERQAFFAVRILFYVLPPFLSCS